MHVSIKQEMIDMRAQEKLGKARSLKEMKHELIDKKSNGKEKCPPLPPVEKILPEFPALCYSLYGPFCVP